MLNNVLKYFNLLSQYPRSSGNEAQVANFLVEFAKQHNLDFYKDEHNNVLIKKQGIKEPIIIKFCNNFIKRDRGSCCRVCWALCFVTVNNLSIIIKRIFKRRKTQHTE